MKLVKKLLPLELGKLKLDNGLFAIKPGKRKSKRLKSSNLMRKKLVVVVRKKRELLLLYLEKEYHNQ